METNLDRDKLVQMAANETLDALRECFIAASLGISISVAAGGGEEMAELLKKLGVKDGFGARAINILTAAGIHPPDVAPLVKSAVDKTSRGN